MNVQVNNIVALNPNIIRVNVVTYTGDLETQLNYELAIPIEEFTENSDGNISVSGDLFQQAVSKRIVAAQNAGNLAVFIESMSLEWELIAEVKTETEAEVDGMTLAYGNSSQE